MVNQIYSRKYGDKTGEVMKIAVFSDVHGNLKALKTVLEQIKEKNVDLNCLKEVE